MRKHCLALIGLGMAVTPHAKSLLDLSDRIEIVAAFSPTQARREAFAQRFDFPLVDSLERVVDDPTIDAVLILTPPNTHFDLVKRVAAAGKHILLEKPLEISTQRAEALVEACRSAQVRLAVMLQHRFRPAGMKLRQMIAQGEIGDVVSCSTSIRLWRPQTYYDEPGRGTLARDGGGVLLTQGIHTLDLMLSLAGPIAEVCGYVATSPVHRMETEDLVCAAVRFSNGALGVIDATTSAYPGFPERIELIGEKASAVLTGTELKVFHHDGRRTELAADQSSGGTGADPMAFPHDYHLAAITDFIDAIESGREPTVSGRVALRVHRLIDALLEAGKTARSVSVRQDNEFI